MLYTRRLSYVTMYFTLSTCPSVLLFCDYRSLAVTTVMFCHGVMLGCTHSYPICHTYVMSYVHTLCLCHFQMSPACHLAPFPGVYNFLRLQICESLVLCTHKLERRNNRQTSCSGRDHPPDRLRLPSTVADTMQSHGVMHNTYVL